MSGKRSRHGRRLTWNPWLSSNTERKWTEGGSGDYPGELQKPGPNCRQKMRKGKSNPRCGWRSKGTLWLVRKGHSQLQQQETTRENVSYSWVCHQNYWQRVQGRDEALTEGFASVFRPPQAAQLHRPDIFVWDRDFWSTIEEAFVRSHLIKCLPEVCERAGDTDIILRLLFVSLNCCGNWWILLVSGKSNFHVHPPGRQEGNTHNPHPTAWWLPPQYQRLWRKSSTLQSV